MLEVDRAVAARLDELRAATRRAATNELRIAATALAHDLTLMTGDERQANAAAGTQVADRGGALTAAQLVAMTATAAE